jgi:hypothetical protein
MRPRGAMGIIKCHAKVNYSSAWHGVWHAIGAQSIIHDRNIYRAPALFQAMCSVPETSRAMPHPQEVCPSNGALRQLSYQENYKKIRNRMQWNLKEGPRLPRVEVMTEIL